MYASFLDTTTLLGGYGCGFFAMRLQRFLGYGFEAFELITSGEFLGCFLKAFGMWLWRVYG